MRTNQLKSASSQGFTLVELIVVITILAILWTIGFLSLQGYSSSARDSQRSTDLSGLNTLFSTRITSGNALPQPDANSIAITASGALIGAQWYAGKNVLGIVGFWGNGLDPTDNQYYTYSANAAGSRYQLLALLENTNGTTAFSSSIVPQAYAASYDTRTPITQGDQLGILLGTTTGSTLNQPAQELYNAASFTGVDVQVNTGSLMAILDNKSFLVNVSSSTWALWGLEMNYRWIMEVVMVDCPKWWSVSTIHSLGTWQFRISFASGQPAKLCVAPINATLQQWTEYVASSCPGNISPVNSVGIGQLSVSCWTGVPCKVCKMSSTSLIPSGFEVVMTACPSGWKESTTITPLSGASAGSCTQNTAFNFPGTSWGNIPCKICIAP